MKPSYQLTGEILQLTASISEKMGAIDAVHLQKPPIELRKKNRIKTIQSSLEIEGNTLTQEQITALWDNKRVIAPKKDILEVRNAMQVYQQLESFHPNQIKDMEKAHAMLMQGLIEVSGERAGKFRIQNVKIGYEGKITHKPPPVVKIKKLMKEVFQYLKKDKEMVLIKSAVFHYELEYIHPFIDGNGRMGRLWQTLILMQQYPVFEFLPVENFIKKNQKEYYKALRQSDRLGHSTQFIEFILHTLLQTLEDFLETQNTRLTTQDRIQLFKEKIDKREFVRKDYLQHFKEISPATASRDLRWGVENNMLIKKGDKRLTKYTYIH